MLKVRVYIIFFPTRTALTDQRLSQPGATGQPADQHRAQVTHIRLPDHQLQGQSHQDQHGLLFEAYSQLPVRQSAMRRGRRRVEEDPTRKHLHAPRRLWNQGIQRRAL